jgi:protein involved in polysaccharide export with SLBB domain
VYVIGEVLKAGGFLFTEDEHITVLQALSMAGGLDRMAQPQNARLRATGTKKNPS